jgi:hypothetical protein
MGDERRRDRIKPDHRLRAVPLLVLFGSLVVVGVVVGTTGWTWLGWLWLAALVAWATVGWVRYRRDERAAAEERSDRRRNVAAASLRDTPDPQALVASTIQDASTMQRRALAAADEVMMNMSIRQTVVDHGSLIESFARRTEARDIVDQLAEATYLRDRSRSLLLQATGQDRSRRRTVGVVAGYIIGSGGFGSGQ